MNKHKQCIEDIKDLCDKRIKEKGLSLSVGEYNLIEQIKTILDFYEV